MDPKSSIGEQLDDSLDNDTEVPDKTEVEKEDEEVPAEDAEEKEEEDKEEDDKVPEDEEEDKEAAKPKEPSLVTRANKKYPGVFKEFPELKEAFFQFNEFRQIFGTVNDARETAAKAELMDGLTGELTDGNIEPLLDTIYEHDPEALKTMVFNFLPTLHGKSTKLFNAVITPVIKNMFAKIAATAAETENEDLLLAVRYCTRAIGLGTDIPRPTKIGNLSRKNEEVETERQSLGAERESMFYSNCESMTDPVIDKDIVDGLDPENVLPEGLREAVIERIKKDVFLALKSNDSHMRTMLALRKSAAANGYSKEYQKKVSRTVINAVKELIPSIRAKHKKRMLGSLVKTEEKDSSSMASSDTTTHSIGGKSNKDSKPIDWAKTSMRDELDKVI